MLSLKECQMIHSPFQTNPLIQTLSTPSTRNIQYIPNHRQSLVQYRTLTRVGVLKGSMRRLGMDMFSCGQATVPSMSK